MEDRTPRLWLNRRSPLRRGSHLVDCEELLQRIDDCTYIDVYVSTVYAVRNALGAAAIGRFRAIAYITAL